MGPKIEKKDNIDNVSYCKDVVQDAYNEFSGVERIIDLKQLDDVAFFEKIQSYNLKTFEEYNNNRNKEFSAESIEKYYPGFIEKFNTIVDKIKNNNISRAELDTSIKSLYEETKESIAA